MANTLKDLSSHGQKQHRWINENVTLFLLFSRNPQKAQNIAALTLWDVGARPKRANPSVLPTFHAHGYIPSIYPLCSDALNEIETAVTLNRLV